MRPVDVVQRKVHPGGEEAIFRGTRNNQVDILRKVFLLFWRTLPCLNLWSLQGVRSWVGIWSSEFRTTFLMKLLHPHRRRLQGIAQKMRYLEKLLTASLRQKRSRAPIAAEAWEILASISWPSRSEYDMYLPRYLKCLVKRRRGIGWRGSCRNNRTDEVAGCRQENALCFGGLRRGADVHLEAESGKVCEHKICANFDFPSGLQKQTLHRPHRAYYRRSQRGFCGRMSLLGG